MSNHRVNDCATQTCLADIFSLGCVYYYVLTGGVHPFGHALSRQAHIASHNYSLSQLENKGELTAVGLIDDMLSEKRACFPCEK